MGGPKYENRPVVAFRSGAFNLEVLEEAELYQLFDDHQINLGLELCDLQALRERFISDAHCRMPDDPNEAPVVLSDEEPVAEPATGGGGEPLLINAIQIILCPSSPQEALVSETVKYFVLKTVSKFLLPKVKGCLERISECPYLDFIFIDSSNWEEIQRLRVVQGDSDECILENIKNILGNYKSPL